MNNLTLLTHYSDLLVPAASDYTQQLSSWSEITENPDESAFYVAYQTTTDASCVVSVLRFSRTNANKMSDVTEIASIPVQDPEAFVAGIKYLRDESALCLAFSSGEVILLIEAPGEEALVESVGYSESGIQTMQWSPDDELVVFVTGANTLLQMNKFFDVTSEQPILSAEFGQDAFINVGWGKKETQFHGSEGKQAAQQKPKMNVAFSNDDDGKPRVSWRGDSQFVCVSIADPSKGARAFRVFDRNMTLCSTSEPVDKLEHTIAWRPSGNWIAVPQRAPNGHDIVLFERNGLRHREFRLRKPANYRVRHLAWNGESSILAIWLVNADETESYVELWSMANYHWYRKFVVSFSDAKVVQIGWSVQDPMCLLAITSKGEFHQMRFVFDIAHNQSRDVSSLASVAQVDGQQICVTPFKLANVPPPMSLFQVNVSAQIQHLSYFGSKNDLILLTSESRLLLCAGERLDRHVTIDISAPGFSRQVGWPDETHVILLRHFESRDFLDIYELGAGRQVISCESIELERPSMLLHANEGRAFLEYDDGSVVEVKMDGTLVPFACFPSPCEKLAYLENESNSIIIGRDVHNKLFFNDRQFASDCSSFYLHSDFLIYTTLDHKTRFIPLSYDLMRFEFTESADGQYDESFRRIERGAKIVTAIAGDIALVYQLPRGNLETVYPRALVLARVRRFIDDNQYAKALVYCRKHRIDMNILCDHDMDKFLQNTKVFVQQIHDADHLNLFLSGLRDEFVSETMYRGIGAPIQNQISGTAEGKVNRVADTVRAACEAVDETKFLYPILTTYVRKNPQELELMLQRIKDLRVTSTKAAEDALRYVIVFVECDTLFDIALGMYDFPLTIMVAQQSHRDPKEYLPFLGELQKLPEQYKRFKIDVHLKRYESAVMNLAKAGEEYFDELFAFIKKHTLFKYALDVYASDEAKYKLIMEAYGDDLTMDGKWEDAAHCHLACGHVEKSLESCMKAGLWRQLFTVAQMNSISETRIRELALEMAEILQDQNKFGDSAVVLVEYAGRPEEAVGDFLKARQWADAMRVIGAHRLGDMVESSVRPAVKSAVSHMKDDLAEIDAKFRKEAARLKVVRESKKKQLQEEASGEVMDADDNMDMYSDTASMRTRTTVTGSQVSSRMSTLSGMTGRTAKNRRKQDRKKWRGKEGSAFEEEYLLHSLLKMAEKSRAIKEELGSLLSVMVQLNMRHEARQLQAEFVTLINLFRDHYKEVFEPALPRLSELPVAIKMKLMGALQQDESEENAQILSRFFTLPAKPEVASRSACLEML